MNEKNEERMSHDDSHSHDPETDESCWRSSPSSDDSAKHFTNV